MATSPQKLTANRENAKHSTGPRTEEGKKASSLNALRHGLTAQVIVLPSEDMEAYRVFSADYVDDAHPVGIIETQFAQTMADTQWRLNRCRALEASLFALGHEQNAPKLYLGEGPEAESIQTALAAAQSLSDNLENLKTLSLYEQRLHRTFQATLKQFRDTQLLRRQQVDQEIHRATRIRNLLTTKGHLFRPADFGFVSSNTQLEIGMRRLSALEGQIDPEFDLEDSPIHQIHVVPTWEK